MPSTVSFYLPDREALGGRDPARLDPDRDWELFGTGVYVWILHTFLRLRQAGAAVRLDAAAPASGMVVAHADHVEQLLAEASSPRELILVSARADRRPQLSADFEIVQNTAGAGSHRFFIPTWLQPGLIPRDPARATSVEVAAYIGTRGQLYDQLASAAWTNALTARGLLWDNRMVAFAGNDQLYSELRWNDYSAIDIVVALRPPEAWRSGSKPAAKLQNAWAAGVPAVLSPEVPYRELRRSALDYLEAESVTDVLRALDRLRADPGLYAAMVENGLDRASEFRHDRVAARWNDLLWREIPARGGTRQRWLARGRGYRALARRVRAR